MHKAVLTFSLTAARQEEGNSSVEIRYKSFEICLGLPSKVIYTLKLLNDCKQN